MTKWVYLATWLRWEWNSGKRVVTHVGAQKIPNKPTLEEYLSQLGAQGWELVTVDNDIYIFKRPQ